jgi:hypothetical protein
MFTKRLLILSGLAVLSTEALTQTNAAPVVSVAAPVPSAIALLGAEHDRLIAEFGRLRDGSLARSATIRVRREFVQFLKTDLLPYLHGSGVVLYVAADSVAKIGGYATVAALFEREAIARQVDEISKAAGASDSDAFRSRTAALGALLDNYFTKEQLLILPILGQRLSESELRALIGQVAAARTSY